MTDELLIRKKKDLDFYKAYLKNNKKEDGDYKKLFYVLAIEIVAFIILSILMSYKMIYYNIQNQSISSRIEKLKGIEDRLKEFQQIKTLFEEKKLINDYVINDNMILYDTVVMIEKVIPKEVVVETMNLSTDKVSLVIRTSKEENIVQFVNNLQNLGFFKNIIFNGISKQDEKIKRTSITAEIVRK